jgi:hypothetical protein
MPKGGKRGKQGFSKISPSNRSQRNGCFRRVLKGGVAPVPYPTAAAAGEEDEDATAEGVLDIK